MSARRQTGPANERAASEIRRWREQAGVSARELSLSCGWAPNQVGRIERGEVQITVEMLDAIARALAVELDRVTICDLIGDE